MRRELDRGDRFGFFRQRLLHQRVGTIQLYRVQLHGSAGRVALDLAAAFFEGALIESIFEQRFSSARDSDGSVLLLRMLAMT